MDFLRYVLGALMGALVAAWGVLSWRKDRQGDAKLNHDLARELADKERKDAKRKDAEALEAATKVIEAAEVKAREDRDNDDRTPADVFNGQ